LIKQYLVYDLRWILLAVPSSWIYNYILNKVKSPMKAMIISQALMGLVVFWIDLIIFGGIK
jgi:hypothetical protein